VITPILPTYGRSPLALERGDGVYVFSDKGERYLDFSAGIAVNALGHAHPHLVKALTEQAQRLWHTSNLHRIPQQERLAQRLVAETFADTIFFCNSGGEAVECSVKMARKFHSANGAPERWRTITFEGAFHGRTLAMIAAGKQKKHTDGFGPLVEGFDQVPFGDLAALRKAITDETAAILLEPVQGESGIRVVEPRLLSAIRELCDEKGILLILDEVQTGFGRTGKLFAHEWADVTPDIMAVAKALGGGFPVGACLATERAASGMTVGSHGSTFGGNPLAMAVGNAVLDVMLAPDFLPHVNRIANHFRQQLAMIADEHRDVIDEVRGHGLLIGVKCKVPNTDVLAALREHHVLAVTGGDNVVRLVPPLIIDESHVREAITALSDVCRTLAPKERARDNVA
jgi:acetylornithine/N-succinyldiaminopimelate aminotransferase